MKSQGFHASVGWVAGMVEIVKQWQEWSEKSRPAPFYFPTGFRAAELPWEIVRPGGRLDQARKMKADCLNRDQFPDGRELFDKIQSGTSQQKTRARLMRGAERFDLEARFWFHHQLQMPELLFTFTIPGPVGQYFLQRVLRVVEPSWARRMQAPIGLSQVGC